MPNSCANPVLHDRPKEIMFQVMQSFIDAKVDLIRACIGLHDERTMYSLARKHSCFNLYEHPSLIWKSKSGA